ncbi:hypothetical protein RYH80_04880 [Halobaculum sp. MBLA0147]|uniref:hypothetical protein n=1 Tax=Halobaculum sp. MBLA0147 TaxID=3079934 RepID=UPI0035238F60
MVRERLDDGVRIAQLLASELSGGATHPGFRVVDADRDVEPTPDGAVAYRVAFDPDETEESALDTGGIPGSDDDEDGTGGTDASDGSTDASDGSTDASDERADTSDGGAGESGDDASESTEDETDDRVVATVHVHPERAHVAVRVAPDAAAAAAESAALRVRPKATRPPQTLVFVEDGAEVKRVLAVFRAVADAVR